MDIQQASAILLGKNERISPTALYTSEVWIQNKRSFMELSSAQGWMLYKALAPAMKASQLVGGPTLSDFLLARHDLIDHCLHESIDSLGIKHVIELAAGLSPRGMRFVKQYGPKVHYIEADLPFMVEDKQKRLTGHLALHKSHEIRAVDAFANEGPKSLASLVNAIPAGEPVAIVTEGLLNYFDEDSVRGLWTRIGKVLKDRPGSVYLSDIHLENNNAGISTQAFKALLAMFVRGQIHLHFSHEQELILALEQAGLSARVLTPSYFADSLHSCGAVGANLTSVLIARADQ